jgi:hypothetical protein
MQRRELKSWRVEEGRVGELKREEVEEVPKGATGRSLQPDPIYYFFPLQFRLSRANPQASAEDRWFPLPARGESKVKSRK